MLSGLRVVEFAGGTAGPYCGRLLAGAGADVVKVEPPTGDSTRRWRTGGAPATGHPAPLFAYLNEDKRSVTGSVGDDEVAGMLAVADLVVEDGSLSRVELAGLRAYRPRLAVVSITPFGRTGPWAGRPATEFTLQAMCGSLGSRGAATREPLQAGGGIGEYVAGAFAAVAATALARAQRSTGCGDHADVSILECMAICLGSYGPLQHSLGRPLPDGPPRTMELPSIEPTADGYVGFCTVTRQQFADFAALIGHPELAEDEGLASFVGRLRRQDEFSGLVQAWTTQRTSAEIIELATLMRIPVAPIGTPETIPRLEQFVERSVFAPSPSGPFIEPRRPFLVDGVAHTPSRAAPSIGEHNGRIDWSRRDQSEGTQESGLPLAGIRVVDFTAFWAGPAATLVLASLGAEVIKVESAQRPDGMRFSTSTPPSVEGWWEWGAHYQGCNANKQGVTLDLNAERGRELVLELVRGADLVAENFTPRVLDGFGITWDVISGLNPRAVMLRMPAFGLSGPWRDRTGFAQTMEQVSGMAWITGYEDGPPVIPRGPCDPNAGLHAAFAALAALEERDRTGKGMLVEATMVEAALNIAAEVVLEHSANGAALTRQGNRGPGAAPQGTYACRGDDEWLALAVTDDQQWSAVVDLLARPDWAVRADLATADGRRAAHDEIDAELARWTVSQDAHELAELLVSHGVPAARVVPPHLAYQNPQLRARAFAETVDHPVVGRHEIPGMPFRLASRGSAPWLRRAAPTLGEHNDQVLGSLGLDADEITALRRAGVIGERPVGT